MEKLTILVRRSCFNVLTLRRLITTTNVNLRPISPDANLGGIRVRFAPSPTGFVHIGGLRTIVYNYLFARSKPGGRFILRIEDTDQERIVPGAADALEETLAWLGMEPDESPLKGGPVGPYVQSQRLNLYQDAVKTLLDNGKAYRCFCSADRLMVMKKEALKNRESVRYDNGCRSLTPEQIDEKLRHGIPYTIRFLLKNEPYPFTDIVYGPYEYRVDLHEGDPVIMKTGGFPTYHLANVVDDHFMQITHVIRGEEWLQSTPKHLQLYSAFGWQPPIFAHLPLMMSKKGEKLSKRDAAANLNSYRQAGYYSLALINFVLSTGGGFDPKIKDKNQLYTLDQLMGMFDLDSLSTRSTKIEPEYLDKYNKEYMKKVCQKSELMADLRRLVTAKFEGRTDQNLQLEHFDDQYLTRMLDQYLADERSASLVNLVENPDNAFLWRYHNSLHPDLLKPIIDKATGRTLDMVEILENLIDQFQNRFVDDYTIDNIKEFLSDFKQLSGLTDRLLMPYIRLLVTNNKRGLPIAEMFYLLGKDRVIQRLKYGINWLKEMAVPKDETKEPLRHG